MEDAVEEAAEQRLSQREEVWTSTSWLALWESKQTSNQIHWNANLHFRHNLHIFDLTMEVLYNFNLSECGSLTSRADVADGQQLCSFWCSVLCFPSSWFAGSCRASATSIQARAKPAWTWDSCGSSWGQNLIFSNWVKWNNIFCKLFGIFIKTWYPTFLDFIWTPWGLYLKALMT